MGKFNYNNLIFILFYFIIININLIKNFNLLKNLYFLLNIYN